MTDLAGRKIMVVEDVFYLAMDVKRALEGAGAEVMGPFANGEAALKSLATGVPDCAVLDVNLGEGASFELARTLKARGAPILFFTGYDRSALPAEFADTPRLEKPVDDARLLREVDGCCRRDAPAR